MMHLVPLIHENIFDTLLYGGLLEKYLEALSKGSSVYWTESKR